MITLKLLIENYLSEGESFQPPKTPDVVNLTGYSKEEGSRIFKNYLNNLKLYGKALIEWESRVPENERLVFEGGGLVYFITKNIGGGWRTTTISKRDHMPMGHEVYSSRLEAIKDRRMDVRIERIPFEIEPLPKRNL